MAIIRRKVFVGPSMYFGFKGVNHYRDRVRDAAEAFINNEIGLERVVSVSEHVASGGPFSVSVWFRADDGADPSQSQTFTNSDLRRSAYGHCAQCGYDLRASTDHCPECGTTISGRKAGGGG